MRSADPSLQAVLLSVCMFTGKSKGLITSLDSSLILLETGYDEDSAEESILTAVDLFRRSFPTVLSPTEQALWKSISNIIFVRCSPTLLFVKRLTPAGRWLVSRCSHSVFERKATFIVSTPAIPQMY